MTVGVRRWSFLALSLTVLAYFLFRLASVISVFLSESTILDRISVTALFCAEAFILFEAVGFFFDVYRADLRYVLKPLPLLQRAPSVTVIIPTAGESYDVLLRTVTATRMLDYPAYRILLVDGSEEEKKSASYTIAQDYPEISYFFVPRPRHGAKAGAVNAALKHIRSPFVALLDADYRPARSFLKRIIPRFVENPTLAFIQTPQFYGNLNESVVSRAAQIQQVYFYEHISEGKSLAHAMFMCGTNLVIRTSALKNVGGFFEGSITEDFATTLRMARCGMFGQYNNSTTAYGDGPRNLEEYFRQQYRWARGTLGTFFSNIDLILSPWSSLTFAQRWEFALSGFHYFIGVVWLILIIFPMLYINFGIPGSFAIFQWYMISYIPYLALSLVFLVQSLTSRRYHKFDWLQAESLTLLTIPTYVAALCDTILHRRAGFHVTRKDAELDALAPSFLFWYAVFFAVSGWSAVYGLFQLSVSPDRFGPLVVSVFWIVYHGGVSAIIPLSIYEARRKRKKNR